MTATTQRPVWRMTGSAYLAVSGIHEPWIAEISPWQYANLPKSQKTAYDKKRSREWEAAGNGKSAWARLVIEAYERGDFTLDDPSITVEARRAVRYHQEEQEKAAFEAKMQIARRENVITEATDVRVGDRVYTLMGGFYTTIKKVNRKSVKIASRYKGDARPRWPGDTIGYPQDDYTTDKGGLQWLHYNELVEAVKNGTPICPQRGDASAA